ncbi:MAG TPA: phosphomannomutase [Candidatus Saccharimonadales bacterium]|nr:phosphomannomutase [Candidatus Saccharimonadales bacterium]
MPKLRDTFTYEPVELTFGTSGLRALVTDMTDLECYLNTLGFLRFLSEAHSLPDASSVYLAGDLRHSTPRILRAVHKAITDAGHKTINCGFIPTPAVTLFGIENNSPSIMVTGSHIPDDRNGIKFIKANGEVLKEDEAAIKAAVAAVREEIYQADAHASGFGQEGQLITPLELPAVETAAEVLYHHRYVDIFSGVFTGKKIVFYQHSSVGRDSLVKILEDLGAEVVPVGRSEKFIPIDTENVTAEHQAYFTQLASEHPDAFAIVSTDGDADRPFVVDEKGTFHRGDVLGAVVATWLKADFAAYPVSASDAVDDHLTKQSVTWTHTRIGSPYVVVAMLEALQSGKRRVTGWEVNGGFMIGNDVEVKGGTLQALPTRDAILPIIIALLAAAEAHKPVSAIFAELPQRFTQAGLIDNFPGDVYHAIQSRFSANRPQVYKELGTYFTAEKGFGAITHTDNLDGVRIYFDNGDIAHLRQSGNAPQLRIYGIAGTQERADDIVRLAITEPDGIFRAMQKDIAE